MKKIRRFSLISLALYISLHLVFTSEPWIPGHDTLEGPQLVDVVDVDGSLGQLPDGLLPVVGVVSLRVLRLPLFYSHVTLIQGACAYALKVFWRTKASEKHYTSSKMSFRCCPMESSFQPHWVNIVQCWLID